MSRRAFAHSESLNSRDKAPLAMCPDTAKVSAAIPASLRVGEVECFTLGASSITLSATTSAGPGSMIHLMAIMDSIVDNRCYP
jgi:hypothetical protein